MIVPEPNQIYSKLYVVILPSLLCNIRIVQFIAISSNIFRNFVAENDVDVFDFMIRDAILNGKLYRLGRSIEKK